MHDVDCAACGAPRPAHAEFKGEGYEWSSRMQWAGLPVVHVAFGRGADGRMRVARGLVAVGQRASGGLAIGIIATGFIAIGVVAAGVFSFGVVAVGLLAAAGVNALAPAAAGVVAIGYAAWGIETIAWKTFLGAPGGG